MGLFPTALPAAILMVLAWRSPLVMLVLAVQIVGCTAAALWCRPLAVAAPDGRLDLKRCSDLAARLRVALIAFVVIIPITPPLALLAADSYLATFVAIFSPIGALFAAVGCGVLLRTARKMIVILGQRSDRQPT